MKDRITIHITSKNRHLPLYGLLQSLRTQTYQEFDILLLDDASDVPYANVEHLAFMMNRLRIENHGFVMLRNNFSNGVCKARNKLIDEDPFDNKYILRLDDDVIAEEHYIECLLGGIEYDGFDIMCGVTPHFGNPDFKREPEYLNGVINYSEFDEEGNLTIIGDDCGYGYLEHNEYEPLLAMHIRSSCLYKKEINDKIRYETNLSFTGFREETFWSFRAMLNGYKMGCDTDAIIWHSQATTGGCRNFGNYQENVNQDDRIFREWCKRQFKEHGNFLKKYYEEYKNEN